MPSGLYLGFDSKLPHRIKKYVLSNQLVDIDWMVESLQKEYKRDYGTRRKKSFRLLVDKVYQSMLDNEELSRPVFKKMKLEQDCNDSDVLDTNDENDEVNCYEYEELRAPLHQDTNLMNQSLVSMYNKEENNKDLVPSSSPQHFQSSDNDITVAKANKTSWVEDQTVKDQVKVLKPVNVLKKSKSAKQNNNSSVHQNQLENDKIKSKVKQKKRKKPMAKTKEKKSANDGTKDEKKDEIDEFSFPTNEFTLQQPEVTFADVAGNDKSLRELSRLLLHMNHPEIYRSLGVSPPRGVLLHGPPGCGKSLLGCAIAGQLGLPLLKLVGPELVTGVSGESERRIRDVFDTAISSAPCVLFLDEIDAVAQKRENASKDMERRMVAQLLACLDDLNKDLHQVMVVGATNKPDVIDPALRRAGRFDREICLGIPDEKARTQILRVVCKDLKMTDDMNFDLISRLTPGYVGADLLSLCREAAMHAVTRILNPGEISNPHDLSATNILDLLQDPKPFPDDKLQKLSVETADFERAVPDVQPSAKREGFATVPDVTWDDIGALENIREELSIAILGPVRNPAAFAALGLTRASGVLLAGPPGCGKTLLAKAIANESGINFISVKGPELLNMYVGESERAVRQCFERARNSSPCVIFFDELDSLCPRRSAIESSASARVVNQMLTELDGLESRRQVFVMAATNRPDIIDPAVLRPGRLDKTLYIGIPSSVDRVKILKTLTKNGTRPPLSDDVCLDALGSSTKCDGFTGADLSALVREASLNAIRGTLKQKWGTFLPDDAPTPQIKVTEEDFGIAFDKVRPSITKKDRALYENMESALHG